MISTESSSAKSITYPCPHKHTPGLLANIHSMENYSHLNVSSSPVTKPTRILTKEQRNDPFADPPPITDSDLQDGMINLLNRGIIPRDVDLTPAFNRGANPFNSQPMRYPNN